MQIPALGPRGVGAPLVPFEISVVGIEFVAVEIVFSLDGDQIVPNCDRGQLVVCIDDAVFAGVRQQATSSWKPAPAGLRGGQKKFSDHAIETTLTLRLVFNLPLRQAEGFLLSLLLLMNVDLEAPDHTTLSRRSQSLNVDLHRVGGNKPIHLIVDSTGLSIVDEGEWAAAKYGGRGKRAWK